MGSSHSSTLSECLGYKQVPPGSFQEFLETWRQVFGGGGLAIPGSSQFICILGSPAVFKLLWPRLTAEAGQDMLVAWEPCRSQQSLVSPWPGVEQGGGVTWDLTLQDAEPLLS